MPNNPDNQLPRNGEIVKIKLSVDANNPLAFFNSFALSINIGIKDEKEFYEASTIALHKNGKINTLLKNKHKK